ncbi:MAG: AAA family ATPase [Candidatus Methanoplasma sp.]|jgi:predicted AAA+ superfamily ATPase|nr:AAA family ATPase [Candidatus Methanoplasma sp.]
MLRRKITENLLKWKANPDKHPLLIRGARQTGKTFIVDDFAKKHYKSCIHINFEDDPRYSEIFNGGLSQKSLTRLISSAFLDIPIIPGDTLLFLDEIQSCPRARVALKFLSGGDFDVIATGSLLGVNSSKVSSYPVGYEEYMDMYSLDFEEFLWAIGMKEDVISYVADNIRDGHAIEQPLLDDFQKYFAWYMAVGGMPEVVNDFIKNNDFGRVRAIQQRIVENCKSDISKYAEGVMKSRAKECLESIPDQMGDRFRYVDVSGVKGARRSMYDGGLEWLMDAGVVFKCHNVSAPVPPLKFNRNFDVFKVYLHDTGLLVSMIDDIDVLRLISGSALVNKGKIAENVVAGEIVRKSRKLMYFERKSKGKDSLEIDFVLNLGDGVAAVEVKSGNNNKSKSLDSVMGEKYRVPRGIKLETTNVLKDDRGVEHYPLFACAFVFPDESGYKL